MFGIAKFLSEVVAWIKPHTQSGSGSRRRFIEKETRMSGWPHSIVRYRHDGINDVALIFIKDLDHMPVRRRVQQLEHIGSRRQNSILDLDGLIYGKNGSFVPRVPLCAE